MAPPIDTKSEEAGVGGREIQPGQVGGAAGSGVAFFAPNIPIPVFEYTQPGPFFNRFLPYVRVMNLDKGHVHDQLCYVLGSNARARRLADLVERSVLPSDCVDYVDVVIQVERAVMQALQREVLNSQILQGLETKLLKPGQSPREFVEIF